LYARRLAIALVSLSVAAIIAAVISQWRATRFEVVKHHNAANVTALVSDALADQLKANDALSRAMAAALSLAPDMDAAEYARIAQHLAGADSSLINLAAMPDYVITRVYPFESNAGLLGVDLRQTDQFARAQLAETTGQSVFDGPINLLQGRVGYLVRSPVIVARNGEASFWGVATAVFDLDGILMEAANIDTLNEFDIAVRGLRDNGDVVTIYGDPVLFDAPAGQADIILPSLHWQVAVGESGAGATVDNSLIWIGLMAGGALATLLIWFADAQFYSNRVAQDRLVASVAALPGGFVYFDASDRLQIFNENILTMFTPTTAKELRGKTWEELMRKDLAAGVYVEAIGHEEEWFAARRLARKELQPTGPDLLSDGRWIHVIESRTVDGGTVGYRIDITAEIESAKRAERAERRLVDAVELLPAGFLLVDPAGTVVMHNKSYATIFDKLPNGSAVGLNFRDLANHLLEHGQYRRPIGADSAEKWESFVNDLMSITDDLEFQLHDGRWIRSYNRRTDDGGMVGIRLDITSSRKQQSELERSNKMLRTALRERYAAQRRFDDIAKIDEYWIWEQDAEGRYSFISPGFYETFPDLPDPVGKYRFEFMKSVAPETEGHDWAWLRRQIADRKPFNGFVYQFNTGGTKPIWVRIGGVPFFDSEGEFQGYRGVGSHVTEFYLAMRDAQAANVAKGEFLNVISHEFRTPLTVILGFNAFIRQSDKTPAGARLSKALAAPEPVIDDIKSAVDGLRAETTKYTDKIEVSGRHLLTLVSDILDISKTDAGALKLAKTTVALDELVAGILDQFSGTAEAKSLQLVSDVRAKTVFADATRLRQILINLVGNALKFTQKGEITITVTHADKATVFSVKDTGVGIAAESLHKVFREFWQADSSANRQAGGTGLGLNIVQSLVRLHGGEVRVESKPGHGSTFSFTIPDPIDEA